MRERGRKLVGLLLATALALLLGEAVARGIWLPQRVLGPVLHRVPTLDDVFRQDDADLLFTASEGTSHRFFTEWDATRRRHAGWPVRGARQRIAIDGYGARGTTHPRERQPNTLRVVFAGPSTLWGLEVDDTQTLSAQLQAALERAPALEGSARLAGVEVWNLSGPAYVMKQSALRARRALADLDPDLVLVMHTNLGPRCQLVGGAVPVAERLRDDAWFLPEYLLPPRWLGAPRFDEEATDWASWVTSVPLGHRLYWGLARRSHLVAALAGVGPRLDPSRLGRNPYTRAVGRVELNRLRAEAAAASVPVVLVSGPSSLPADDVLGLRPEHVIDLARPDLPWIFQELHPPPWVLGFHADTIAYELSRAGLVPMRVAAPSVPERPAGHWPVGEDPYGEQRGHGHVPELRSP